MEKKWLKVICLGIMIISLGKLTSIHATENNGFVYPEYMQLLDQLIESENKYGLTGAQLAVYKDGQLIKNTGYGYTNNYYDYNDEYGNLVLTNAKVLPTSERTAVTTETLFDMASNTKMYATVYSMQKLISDKVIVPGTINPITLETKISDIFPEFLDESNENHWKERITVGLVLSHYAGFAPDPQYHNENYDEDDGTKNGRNDLFSQDKQTTFEMVMKTPITTEPSTSWAYSDVDMMMAGFIVERLTGQDLDTFVKNNFYNPLNLNRLTFNPLEFGFQPIEIASTELHGNTRDGRIIFQNGRMNVITGQVHDEKAFYSMGGVSGHAGLFGTAQQVAYLAQAMVYGGNLAGVQLFNQDVINQFTKPTAGLATQAEGGWRRKSETGGATSWFSKFAPAGTVGHTGWTGTNTMIDFQNHLTLSLMTNARNTPIMGPGANTFYTASSNISSYGTVSELVYRALGLGTDESHSPEMVLEKMIVEELSGVDLSTATSSKRNVIRALLDTLATRALTDSEAKKYQSSPFIQSIAVALKQTEPTDVRFLVVTKNLDQGIAQGNELLFENYTKASSHSVISFVKKGENLLARNDYTQEQVDELASQLQQSLNTLVSIEQLRSLVEQTVQLPKEAYTNVSWQRVSDALQIAQKELNDEAAAQATIDTATSNLQVAIQKLVKPGDKTALKQAIQTAEALDRNGYTIVSFNRVGNELSKAKDLVADSEATQEIIDQVTQNLTIAMNQLEKVTVIVNKSSLQTLVEEMEVLTKSKDRYTAESWKPFALVLKKALAILTSDTATQEEVNKIAHELKLANQQLKTIPEKAPSELTKQVENSTKASSTPSEGKFLPKTGMVHNYALVGIGIVIIASVVGIIGFRRKKYN